VLDCYQFLPMNYQVKCQLFSHYIDNHSSASFYTYNPCSFVEIWLEVPLWNKLAGSLGYVSLLINNSA